MEMSMDALIEVHFAWDWQTAYRTAVSQVASDRVRYRVTAKREPSVSPTGWCWSWDAVKAEHPCPKCGSETVFTTDCPTYKSALVGWMRCNPPCGEAGTWDCTRKACGWWFAEGYAWDNPNNQHLLAERGAVPEWLSEDK